MSELFWQADNQPNGIGWMTRCSNYAIRQCVYEDGRPTEYWCYYKVSPEDVKFMHLFDGVKTSLEDAHARCLGAYKMSEAWRFECEVVTWIRKGYTTKEKLAQLGNDIQKRRGREAAVKLYRAIVAKLGETNADKA